MTLGTAGADWAELKIFIIMIFSIVIFAIMMRWLTVAYAFGWLCLRLAWVDDFHHHGLQQHDLRHQAAGEFFGSQLQRLPLLP